MGEMWLDAGSCMVWLHGMVWDVLVRAWYGMVWYGMVWYGRCAGKQVQAPIRFMIVPENFFQLFTWKYFNINIINVCRLY